MSRAAARATTALAALLAWRALADVGLPSRPPPRPLPARGATRLLHAAPLAVNREPAHVLSLLPGIGPGRAAALVAARPVCGWADLDALAGFGPATLRRLAGKLAFDAAPGDCDGELRAARH